MNILTIDTSDGILVGLCQENMGVVKGLAQISSADTRHHAEKLSPYVKEVMERSGVERPDAVVVGTGPAAFTGLRAGLVTGRTLAQVWDVPVYGLSSLEVLAVAASDEGVNIAEAVIDARRGEVYALRARAMGPDDVSPLADARVVKPDTLARELSSHEAVLVKNELHADLYADIFDVYGLDVLTVTVTPEHMVRLLLSRLARLESGEDVDLGTEPQYLRRPDVHSGAHAQPQAQDNPYGINA